ncbi:MAG TPA: hypothetical protein VGR38_00735 [Candidatus Polarisedimenticolia bacterium]|nr:hypothetical protein [Candidatus Polarisedimenticolia bacterium]
MFTRPRSFGMEARRIAGRGAALTIAVLLGAGSSTFAAYWDTDCHALKLKAATGAPAGAVRTYDFEGTCNVVFVLDTGPKVEGVFPAKAHAAWDEGRKQLSETFTILGTFRHPDTFRGFPMVSGDVQSVYACNEDPIIVQKGVACNGVSHVNNTGLKELSKPYKHLNRPITRGKTTLAEAAALSGGLIGQSAVTFPRPVKDGRRIDVCYVWGSLCGAPAANAYCRLMGFARSSTFTIDKGIGAQSATLVLGDGKVCNQPSCDGFASITCTKQKTWGP